MCELLGLCFNQLVRPSLSVRGFGYSDKDNPDGWGIGFYPDQSAQIFKEPIKASSSDLFRFLRDYPKINSKLVLAHIRKKTIAEPQYMNSHPFSRELDGDMYIFAHNGTIEETDELSLGRFKPIGSTDSEHTFCHLIDKINKKEIKDWSNNFSWIHNLLKEINKFGKFNCIFSDGEYLFCYHDTGGHNSFYYVRREAPYGEIKLMDEDLKVNLDRETDPNQKGFIAATNRLTNENWKEFKKGELIILKNGEIVYQND
ncbi:class II glutamine amidotransferase [Methanonatronarchaeum sp. AMET-Sl]|nr:class II glutamine amidotransferase [Methanonatronarchaeum sp. AMET-Sl]WGI18078.1 class II glutamine amidotransferase [Methanonatronarchaeum sp. AMET-Sl]